MGADLADRLEAWAQNEEMIDQHYTSHGKDCREAATLLRGSVPSALRQDTTLQQAVVQAAREIRRLEKELVQYQKWFGLVPDPVPIEVSVDGEV